MGLGEQQVQLRVQSHVLHPDDARVQRTGLLADDGQAVDAHQVLLVALRAAAGERHLHVAHHVDVDVLDDRGAVLAHQSWEQVEQDEDEE